METESFQYFLIFPIGRAPHSKAGGVSSRWLRRLVGMNMEGNSEVALDNTEGYHLLVVEDKKQLEWAL